MTRIDLSSPVPRPEPDACPPFPYTSGLKRYLRIPELPASDPGFFSIITARRTRREFADVAHELFSDFLWYSAKAWSGSPDLTSRRWQHRTSPSSGGIHCIDLLIIPASEAPVMLYEPVAHALREIEVDKQRMHALLHELKRTINPGLARVIWFAADFDMMLSRYESGESLVWRDAGALISTMCFVAEALQLACCPIGMTGEPHISAMLGSSGRIAGVGGILIGARP